MPVGRHFLGVDLVFHNGFAGRFRHVLFELFFDRIEAFFCAGMQEAEVADFLKAFGQYVL